MTFLRRPAVSGGRNWRETNRLRFNAVFGSQCRWVTSELRWVGFTQKPATVADRLIWLSVCSFVHIEKNSNMWLDVPKVTKIMNVNFTVVTVSNKVLQKDMNGPRKTLSFLPDKLFWLCISVCPAIKNSLNAHTFMFFVLYCFRILLFGVGLEHQVLWTDCIRLLQSDIWWQIRYFFIF